MGNLNALKDEQLVILYAEGVNRAFDVLLDRYKNKLFSYIVFSVKNKEVAEDIFQETFVKAIVTIRGNKYSETGRFYQWIMRIAHNLIIDHFRNLQGANVLSNDDVDYDLLNNSDLCEDNVEDVLVKEQVLCDVVSLVERLPQCQREIINLRHKYQYGIGTCEICGDKSEENGGGKQYIAFRLMHACVALVFLGFFVECI